MIRPVRHRSRHSANRSDSRPISSGRHAGPVSRRDPVPGSARVRGQRRSGHSWNSELWATCAVHRTRNSISVEGLLCVGPARNINADRKPFSRPPLRKRWDPTSTECPRRESSPTPQALFAGGGGSARYLWRAVPASRRPRPRWSHPAPRLRKTICIPACSPAPDSATTPPGRTPHQRLAPTLRQNGRSRCRDVPSVRTPRGNRISGVAEIRPPRWQVTGDHPWNPNTWARSHRRAGLSTRRSRAFRRGAGAAALRRRRPRSVGRNPQSTSASSGNISWKPNTRCQHTRTVMTDE